MTIGIKTEKGPNEALSERTPEQWFAMFYAELRQMAARKLQGSPASNVSPTTLVHELFVNLNGRVLDFPDQHRFMGYAARAMRGLVIDFARQRQAMKRGDGFEITHLTGEVGAQAIDDQALARLSDALDHLAGVEPALAEVVDLKYFCGFTLEEIGALRGVSTRTVRREWEKARLFLFEELGVGGL